MKTRVLLSLLAFLLLGVLLGSLPSCGSNPAAPAPVTVTQPVTILVTATNTATFTATNSPTVTNTPIFSYTPTNTPTLQATPAAYNHWPTSGTLGFTLSDNLAFVGDYGVAVDVYTLGGLAVTTIGEGVYASGMIPDGTGGIYNTGACNGGIYRISNAPAYVGSAPATGCTRGIATDGTYLYITDGDGGNYIHKYTTAGAAVTQWAVPGGNPWGIAIGGSPQTIFTASKATSVLYTYDLNGNQLAPSWSLASDGTALAVDANGKLYACGESGVPAQRFTATGTLETQWGSFNSYGIAFDGTGKVYVGDTSAIWIYTP